MKTYTATYIRHNPQLGNYETTRTFEARSIASARKIAREKEKNCVYGWNTLIDVKESA